MPFLKEPKSVFRRLPASFFDYSVLVNLDGAALVDSEGRVVVFEYARRLELA